MHESTCFPTVAAFQKRDFIKLPPPSPPAFSVWMCGEDLQRILFPFLITQKNAHAMVLKEQKGYTSELYKNLGVYRKKKERHNANLDSI